MKAYPQGIQFITTISQITDTVGGGTNQGIAISSDGETIAFSSYADHTGENSDGNDEQFIATYQESIIVPVMNTGGFIFLVTVITFFLAMQKSVLPFHSDPKALYRSSHKNSKAL